MMVRLMRDEQVDFRWRDARSIESGHRSLTHNLNSKRINRFSIHMEELPVGPNCLSRKWLTGTTCWYLQEAGSCTV